MHADVDAGRQINQTWKWIIGIFLNEYINPPCNCSITTSCIESTMGSSSDEGKATAPFTEGVSSSAERELVTDENASTDSLAPKICAVPDLSVAARQGKNVSENFWIIWVTRRVLRVVKFWQVRLLMMIVSSISWGMSLRPATLSQRAWHLLMCWHVQNCEWRR